MLKCGLSIDAALAKLKNWDAVDDVLDMEVSQPPLSPPVVHAPIPPPVLHEPAPLPPPLLVHNPPMEVESTRRQPKVSKKRKLAKAKAPTLKKGSTPTGVRASGVAIECVGKNGGSRKYLVCKGLKGKAFKTSPGVEYNYRASEVDCMVKFTHGADGKEFPKPIKMSFVAATMPEKYRHKDFLRTDWRLAVLSHFWEVAIQSYEVAVSCVRRELLAGEDVDYLGKDYDESEPVAPTFPAKSFHCGKMGMITTRELDMSVPITRVVEELWAAVGVDGRPRTFGGGSGRVARAPVGVDAEDSGEETGSDEEDVYEGILDVASKSYKPCKRSVVDDSSSDEEEDEEEDEVVKPISHPSKRRKVVDSEEGEDVAAEPMDSTTITCARCGDGVPTSALRYFVGCESPHYHCHDCVYSFFKQSSPTDAMECSTCHLPAPRDCIFDSEGDTVRLPVVRTRCGGVVNYSESSMVDDFLASDDEVEDMVLSGEVEDEVEFSGEVGGGDLTIHLGDNVAYEMNGSNVWTKIIGVSGGEFPWLLENGACEDEGLSRDTVVVVDHGGEIKRGKVVDFQLVTK